MNIFTSIANNTHNRVATIVYSLIRQLGAKVTRNTVIEALKQHPYYPALLSLSDVLSDWQIENAGLKLNSIEQLRELPLPFIAHIQDNNGSYVHVKNLKNDTIDYFESEKGQISELLIDFEQKWSGVVLLVEASSKSRETNYETNRRDEILSSFRVPFISIGTLLAFSTIVFYVSKVFSYFDWVLFFSKTTGLFFSVLLVIKELGGKSSLTDHLCHINDKINCDAVLNSSGAKLWGWLSWTDVGLIYFSGGLLAVLTTGLQSHIYSLLCGLALPALFYTVFSIYYQGRVARQWCTLCLCVQGVLLAEGLFSISQPFTLPNTLQPYLLLLICFLLPTLAWVVLKPLIINLSKSHHEHNELVQFKRDPILFREKLFQQPEMFPLPDGLRYITLGSSTAEHSITVVMNPYCNPCAKAHKQLQELLHENKNVKANILFASDGVNGPATQFTAQLLALNDKGSVDEALADWFESSKKNFEDWVKKFPAKANSVDWKRIALQHGEWCLIADIKATPALFVDGYALPEPYLINSLRWVIDYLPAFNLTMDLAKSK